MAQTKVKKKASPASKRLAAKPAPGKKPAAKPLAKKASAAKKPKPVAKGKAKPAPAKAKPVKAAKNAKPVAKKPLPSKKPVAKAKPAPAKKTAAPAGKRAVAVSQRQTAAVTVQSKPTPAKAAPPVAASKLRPAGKGTAVATGPIANEDQIRRAPDSAYMNEAQLAFFQERLLQMRSEVLTRELDVKERLHQREVFADPADRASAEEEHWLDLRLRERESLLLKKIDDALRRIRDRDYGYCEKTGEAIGIARLLARPTATVCVDIKGQDERAESQYRDR